MIKNKIRKGASLLSVGFLGVFGGGFLSQCAPQTCADKPGAEECQPPRVVGSPSGTSANVYAGRQYLQEANQTLIRVALVCSGNSWWTYGPYSNADNTTANTVSAYWSCWPRLAVQMSYETAHS